MQNISDAKFVSWQKRLATDKWFGWFWKWWGLYAIIIYGAAGFYLLVRDLQNWKIVAIATIAGLFCEFVVNKLIHLVRRKPHPYQRLKLNTPGWWLMSLKDSVHDAFPSEHASTTAAISITIFLFFPAWGWLLLALPVVIAMGRIVLAYHDIADVVWGYPIGLLSGYVVYILLYPRLFTG
ncbi:MAG: phosphatase PAP2 family protein [Patescibacteria group bacterium]|nr:phosphatase PAP2 family protein [Patescibacteria group bacterium]